MVRTTALSTTSAELVAVQRLVLWPVGRTISPAAGERIRLWRRAGIDARPLRLDLQCTADGPAVAIRWERAPERDRLEAALFDRIAHSPAPEGRVRLSLYETSTASTGRRHGGDLRPEPSATRFDVDGDRFDTVFFRSRGPRRLDLKRQPYLRPDFRRPATPASCAQRGETAPFAAGATARSAEPGYREVDAHNSRQPIPRLPGSHRRPPAYRLIPRKLLEADPFVLAEGHGLNVVYAPFDHVNAEAMVALVGVTPGWTQMHAAFVEARSGIGLGLSSDEILRRVKTVAAFSGPLRNNLSYMLDGIGISEALGLESAAALFTPDGESQLHSTSAVRYPVFRNGRSYTGSMPAISDSSILAPYLDVLADELAEADRAIVIPLGKAVEGALTNLVSRGLVAGERCLFGFPHPSGANAHRASQYAENRMALTAAVRDWFDAG